MTRFAFRVAVDLAALGLLLAAILIWADFLGSR